MTTTWNPEAQLRTRQAAIAAFTRDVVEPLRQAAAERIAAARPFAFNTDKIPHRLVQATMDRLIDIGAAVAALDLARVEEAIGAWERANRDMFARFEAERQKWACPECGHWGPGCLHRPAPTAIYGEQTEALYPGGGWTRPTE